MLMRSKLCISQVFDPNKIEVQGLDVGLMGQNLEFTVDASNAGHGTVKVNNLSF